MDHLGELDLPAVTAAVQRFASGTPSADPQQVFSDRAQQEA